MDVTRVVYAEHVRALRHTIELFVLHFDLGVFASKSKRKVIVES